MAVANQSCNLQGLQEDTYNHYQINNFPTSVVCNSRLTPPLTNSPGRYGDGSDNIINNDVAQLADLDSEAPVGVVFSEEELRDANLYDKYCGNQAPQAKLSKQVRKPPSAAVPMVKIQSNGKQTVYTGKPPPPTPIRDLEQHFKEILQHAFAFRSNENLSNCMELLVGGEGMRGNVLIDKALLAAYSTLMRETLSPDANRFSVMLPNYSSKIMNLFVELLYFGHAATDNDDSKDITLIAEVMDQLSIPYSGAFETFVMEVKIKEEIIDEADPAEEKGSYILPEEEIDYIADGSTCYIPCKESTTEPIIEHLVKPTEDPRIKLHAYMTLTEGRKVIKGKHHSIETSAKRAKLLEHKRRLQKLKQIRENKIEFIDLAEDGESTTTGRSKRSQKRPQTPAFYSYGDCPLKMGKFIETGALTVDTTSLRKVEPPNSFTSPPIVRSNSTQQTSTMSESIPNIATFNCLSDRVPNAALTNIPVAPVVMHPVVPPRVVMTASASPQNPGESMIEEMPQLRPIIEPETQEVCGDDAGNDTDIPELDNINEEILQYQLSQTQNNEHLVYQNPNENNGLGNGFPSLNINPIVSHSAPSTSTTYGVPVARFVTVTKEMMTKIQELQAKNKMSTHVEDGEMPSTSAAMTMMASNFEDHKRARCSSSSVSSPDRKKKSRKKGLVDGHTPRTIVVGSKKIPAFGNMKVDKYIEEDQPDNNATRPLTAPSSTFSATTTDLQSNISSDARDQPASRLRRRVGALQPESATTSSTTRTGRAKGGGGRGNGR